MALLSSHGNSLSRQQLENCLASPECHSQRLTSRLTVMFATRLLWMFVVTRAVIGTATYSGSRFIFARFPAYQYGNGYATAYFLSIAHTREGRCTVTESNGADYYIQLSGNNSVTQFHLPTDRVITPGVAVEEDRAVELICTTEVTLSVLQRRVPQGLADAFPVLPVKSLSTKYIVPSVPNNALVGVVAFYDNTNVTVHLNSTCSYPFRGNTYGRGSQLSMTLLQGEVLQIASSQSSTSNTCDLGGSVVESSQSVAVFSGSPFLCDAGCCDGAMSQVPPLETWGTSFIVPPVPNMTVNRVRIIAGYHGTNITIDTFTRVESIILNEAEIYDEDVTEAAAIYIRSSYPILVLQIGEARICQIFQAIVPATDAYGTNYLIPEIKNSSMSYTRDVNIITSSNCTSHININERWSVQSRDSQTFAIASFQPSSGTTTFESNSSACSFGVLVTGSGDSHAEMYGYFSTPVRADSVGSLEDSVNLTCTYADWVVKVNTQEIATVFPTSVNKNIFMSNAFCPGVLEGDVLVFNVSYNDCNTVIETNNNTVKFSNYLIEYERDAQTNLASGALWRYNLTCVLRKHETYVKPFLPVDQAEVTVQATSKIQGHKAVMKFYTDDTYTNEMKGNPLKVGLGTRVYVQVQVQTGVPADVKLLVDNCYISTDIQSGNSTRVPIMHNRCEANHFTHIVGHVYTLTRFYFDVFEMPHLRDNLYVACDVSFCPLMDFAPECQSGCLSTHL